MRSGSSGVRAGVPKTSRRGFKSCPERQHFIMADTNEYPFAPFASSEGEFQSEVATEVFEELDELQSNFAATENLTEEDFAELVFSWASRRLDLEPSLDELP